MLLFHNPTSTIVFNGRLTSHTLASCLNGTRCAIEAVRRLPLPVLRECRVHCSSTAPARIS